MKTLLAFAALLPLLISCSRGRETMATLDDVFSYMESRPDSALTVLEGMNKEDLTSRRNKAKHALLYSMALDKNWIDLTCDSIIAPAVSYYNNHGSAEEKLLTYYYRGRISMNAGDYEEAISYFVLAEDHVEKSGNNLAAARLYKAKTKVFQYCFDTGEMIASAEKAAEYFLLASDTTRYLNSVNDIITAYLQREDTLNTRRCLNVLKSYFNKLSAEQISMYYSGLMFLNEYTSEYLIKDLFNEYQAAVEDPGLINWIAVADAFAHSADYENAKLALDYFKALNEDLPSGYYFLAGVTLESLGHYKESAEAFRNCLEQNSEKNGYLFEADVRFIEERFMNEISILRKNYGLIILALCALALILAILVISLQMEKVKNEKLRIEQEKEAAEKEKARYIEMYTETEQEIVNLKKTLKETKLTPQVRAHITKRLSVLNKFIAANITANYSKEASDELMHLMTDRAQFIESTRLTFYLTYPKFLNHLSKSGLTELEIGYCCLYAIGLKGKDISNYIGSNGQYKISSTIRQKLGLTEHDTNIDIYLRRLLEKHS